MSTDSWFANGIQGRHVLLGLVAFFGVMLFANMWLVYFALETFSGGDRPDPYRAGLQYNETLAAAERQAALGWRANVAYDDKKGQLTLSFLDKTAAPVTGLDIGATVSRPATDKEDHSLRFKEVGQGMYAADVRLAPGVWTIVAASREAGRSDPVYRLKERLFVAARP
jgi:nitrogen fixation protein FixH